MLSTVLLLAASMVVGQAEDGERTFASFAEATVGTWTSKVDGVEEQMTYRLILNGKFIQWTHKSAGPERMAMIGVDPNGPLVANG